jgi:tRNA pseudouridine65 synthase
MLSLPVLVLVRFFIMKIRDLQIIYRDNELIAINKPAGLPVHKSSLVGTDGEFALQLLRNQIGCRVYPVHRLDSKTSGVMLFALNPEINRVMQKMFAGQKIFKTYLAIVRGFTALEATIDYPLISEKGTLQDAVTHYKSLAQAELDFPSGKHQTSRYSLVEIHPETGRMHQIRRHFAHIFHPIIGDRPHGCNKQNRFFQTRFGVTRMLLHAGSIRFNHPILKQDMEIVSPPGGCFIDICKTMGWFNSLTNGICFHSGNHLTT